ncbi:uncharacterized protein [Antedon mediterranea]
MMGAASDRLAAIKMSTIKQIARWIEVFKLREWIDCLKVWAMVHPFLAVFAIVFLLSTSVPVMIFLSFTGCVLLFGIISFAFIEGLILTTSTAILLTSVGFVATAALGFTGFIISCYFVLQLGYRFLDVATEKVRHGYNGVATWYKPDVSHKIEESQSEVEDLKVKD